MVGGRKLWNSLNGVPNGCSMLFEHRDTYRSGWFYIHFFSQCATIKKKVCYSRVDIKILKVKVGENFHGSSLMWPYYQLVMAVLSFKPFNDFFHQFL